MNIKKNAVLTLTLASLVLTTGQSFARKDSFDYKKYCRHGAEACDSWTPAMVGGPVSKGKNELTVRYMADANVELTYNNQVILLSAYYDKGPDNLSFVDMEKVARADAIFIGHAHFDHMNDAARMSKQTGAPIYGHWTVTNTAMEQGVSEDKLVEVFNGDVFQFDGFSVEAIRVMHSGTGDISQTPAEITALFNSLNAAIRSDLEVEKSAEQIAWENRPDKGYGTFDPAVRSEGTFAYLFTFGKDFHFIYYDSANAEMTPELLSAMERIGGKTDLATMAYAGGPEAYAVMYDMPGIKTLNANYFFPNHGYPTHIMDPSPLFKAIRDELPDTTPISMVPRQALTFDVYKHELISDGIVADDESDISNKQHHSSSRHHH